MSPFPPSDVPLPSPVEHWPDADWAELAAYLDRAPVPAVVRHTEHRLATDPSFARLAAPLLAVWATPTLPTVDKAAAWVAIQQRLAARAPEGGPSSPPAKRPRSSPIAGLPVRRYQSAFLRTTLAASICLMALNVLAALHDRGASHAIVQYTTVTTLRTIHLTDHSTVTLAAGSTLLTDSTDHATARTVYLNGTGDFDVQADPTHPFIVESHGVAAVALGTTFHVAVQDRATDGTPDIHIGVTTGKVEVQRTDANGTQHTLAVLGPGQETSVQTFQRYFLAGWAAGAAHKSVAAAYYENEAMKAADARRDLLRKASSRQSGHPSRSAE
jgi:hypothetical protein